MMAAAPVRVQRFRRHPLPPGAVYVGRPTRWGNPFRIGPDRTRSEAVAEFRTWLRACLAADPTFLDPLRGARFLACWCPLDGGPCHADVIREALAG